jgi:hypothetical protein
MAADARSSWRREGFSWSVFLQGMSGGPIKDGHAVWPIISKPGAGVNIPCRRTEAVMAGLRKKLLTPNRLGSMYPLLTRP